MRLIKNTPTAQTHGATVAQVTFSEPGNFGAVGSAEHRGIPVFAPKGISYAPSEGDNLLILPVDGTDTCIGTLVYSAGLPAGELRLTSVGGAEIRLKNDGSITLNGLTITKEGAVL